jgi:anti-sigma factor ChrR (cupin superfamily)
MRVAAAVNADPNKVAVANTNEMPWEKSEHAGITRKVLEFVNDPKKGRETALLKFAPGASLPAETLVDRLDVYVLEGTLSDGGTDYVPETFMRIQPGSRIAFSSNQGCTIYAKWRVPIRPGASGERMVLDTKTANWLDFPHRGAKVLHLYKNTDGIETGRIGNVYPERKLPSHDHSIGEETFVLEGCLSDEYTAYHAGTWFRMPCGKPHAPFTGTQNAKMLIREGDLVW